MITSRSFTKTSLTSRSKPAKSGHTSRHERRRHRSGAIHYALKDRRVARRGQDLIHHFAIEVDDFDKSVADIKKLGCEIISDPGVVPVKFSAPGGTVAEIVPTARYKKPQ
jgi:hypothetical protein